MELGTAAGIATTGEALTCIFLSWEFRTCLSHGFIQLICPVETWLSLEDLQLQFLHSNDRDELESCRRFKTDLGTGDIEPQCPEESGQISCDNLDDPASIRRTLPDPQLCSGTDPVHYTLPMNLATE